MSLRVDRQTTCTGGLTAALAAQQPVSPPLGLRSCCAAAATPVHLLMSTQVRAQVRQAREPAPAALALQPALAVAGLARRDARGGAMVFADVPGHVAAPEELGAAVRARHQQSAAGLVRRRNRVRCRRVRRIDGFGDLWPTLISPRPVPTDAVENSTGRRRVRRTATLTEMIVGLERVPAPTSFL